MNRGQRASWLLPAVSMVLSSACLDFDAAERRFCDSGNSAVCGNTGIGVTVQIDPAATTTRCVKVAAEPPGKPELSTYPIPRSPGTDSVASTIYQGQLPEDIVLLARGYDDPLCTRLNEEGASSAARFVPGEIVAVTLQLNGSPCVRADAGTACPSGVCRSDQACVGAGTEFNCVNGTDDDGDGRSDCADPDCLGVGCASPDLCLASPVCLADGGCGGPPKACNTPPTFCDASPGTCNPSNGACSYAPDAGFACDDSSLCTTADHCLLDGGCGGTAVTCNTPPSACFGSSTGCDPILGCRYPVLVGAACSDGNLCTSGDRCSSDGGCAGTSYSCPPTECASSRACLGDGGCAVTTPKTGQACTGGVCTDAGTCQTFPYTPSNFNPVAVAAAGVGGAAVLSCNAWFNSTDGGINWCSGQPLPSITAITQNDGTTPAVVLSMSGLTITGSLTLMGARPVILAVYGDATISGTLSARSAMGTDAGAGSMPAGACGAQSGNIAGGSVGSGGGGGSYGTAGGNGGDLTGTGGVQGGNGGGANGNLSITPLRGGCSGGEGGRPNDAVAVGGRGGAGGGGIQLSAARFLQVSGTVTASGAGGQGGLCDQTGLSSEGGNGGGGGGSGGAVLLEGQDVQITSVARLTANGGGGGEGGDGVTTTGNNGASGSDGPPGSPAGGAGGAGQVSCAGDGAAGGSAASSAGTAGNVTFASGGCATGGGGGAAGRIRVNASQGCQVDAGVQSPVPSFGGPCP